MTLSLYTDGGCITKNPSPLGGTWAYCIVEGVGERKKEDAGIITPPFHGLTLISNNVTELLAAIKGLENMPDGWDGIFYTDSLITLRRVTVAKTTFNGIPTELKDRLHHAKLRLGKFSAELLGGHPNEVELALGVREDGKPVSYHNIRCDVLCQQAAAGFLAQRRQTALSS